MNNAKRLFFVNVIVLTLTAVTCLVDGAGCRAPGSIDKGGFKVRCTSDLSIDVVCHSDDWTTFPNVKINRTFVSQIRFRNCSFPQNLSLLDTVRSLDVKKLKTIRFEELRSAPNRRNLRGLSVPRLEFFNSHFAELSSDMLYDVLNVEALTINNNNFDRIPENFFKNWSKNLRSVDLMTNKLRKIGKNDFAHLHDVSNIVLYNNTISEIEAGAFDSLPSLVILELSKNHLHTLPPAIFRHLARLEKVNLGENPLDELPSDLLTNIEDCHLKLFRMNYAYGSLRTLPNAFFKNLAFLSDVELVSAQLESLPADLFAETSELENLTFKNNQLRSIPAGFFNDTKKLRNLELEKNLLESLPAGLFEELDYLDKLDISYNNLTNLTSDVLIGLHSVSKFNASHNNLIKIDDNFCEYLVSVKIIDFSFNQLTFEKQIKQFEHESVFMSCADVVHEMYLSNNKATNMFDDWYYMTNIKRIDLSYNEFTEFNANDTEKLIYGEFVDLQHNKISKIDLSKLSSTVTMYNERNTTPKNVTINLGNNPLNCDCHLLDFVRYLNTESSSDAHKHVKLIFDSLSCASPAEFEKHDVQNIHPEDLNCLLKTDVAEDACNNTCTCHEYPGKQTLSVDCSRKNLTMLPATIGNWRNWSIELNMSSNILQKTPSLNSPYLVNVNSLDLSSNNISTVTVDAFSKSLVDLKLHNNSISRLESKVIEHLANNNTLRAITLHDNRWTCDCEARNFLSFVQKKAQIYKLYEVTCHATNAKMYEMTVNDLCKGAIAIIVGASLLVAFFGIIIGSLAALYYKYQKEIKVWLYSKQLCMWFVTEDELDKDKKYDAFISFSHKDEDFVEREIVAALEDGPTPYKLCLHYRDWLAGEWIPVQISRSVEESRRTIVVLSPNFLESVWGRIEFRTAHTQALKDGRARVIVILYGEIENMDGLDPELKAYLSLNTYVKWGDPWFWDKLRYALPHRHERRTRNARRLEDHLMQRPANNSNAISMAKLANDSAKLLDSTGERIIASC